jgi:hypothetical protein
MLTFLLEIALYNDALALADVHAHLKHQRCGRLGLCQTVLEIWQGDFKSIFFSFCANSSAGIADEFIDKDQ